MAGKAKALKKLIGLLEDAAPPAKKMPAVTGKADPGREVLRKVAEEMELPAKKRTKPTGETFFETSPEAYRRTKDIVPQRDFSSSYPQPVEGKPLPAKGRMAPILEDKERVAAEYARRMQPFVGKNVEYFYHTGPMYEGIERVSPGRSAEVMDRFGSTYAGTSPRTATEQNLRNASLLAYKRDQGIPFDQTVLPTGTANDKGYPMMDMHRGLTDRMLSGIFDFDTNPKPNSFRENVMGNLQGVTADTHNIRGVLTSFDTLNPGQIPREWFNSDKAFAKYKAEGLTPDILAGGINDSLQSQAVGGVSRQSEYGPIAGITQRSSEILGTDPAATQSLGWFALGDQTNLKSAPKTVTDLMNERLNVTAQHLGLPMDVVAKLWAEGKIPLAAVGGAAAATGLLADPGEAEAGPRIRAFHGSPHRFDEFRWGPSTRGIGEGSQAYGDGLYFAENEDVAKQYRSALEGKGG